MHGYAKTFLAQLTMGHYGLRSSGGILRFLANGEASFVQNLPDMKSTGESL